MLNIIPKRLDTIIKIKRIIIFSFFCLFCLNSINNPTPEPANKPEIQLPKGIRFWIYNSVIMTLDAQFGINPIIDVISGDKILLLLMKSIINSLSMIRLTKIFIIKMKIVIFNVWIILDLIIPFTD